MILDLNMAIGLPLIEKDRYQFSLVGKTIAHRVPPHNIKAFVDNGSIVIEDFMPTYDIDELGK